jgi:hypothetical protein
MPIQYALFENHVTSDPNDYRGIIQNMGSWDLDTVVKKVVLRGTTVNEADVRAVIITTLSVCAEGVTENNHVNLGGFVDFFPRLKGGFVGPDGPWTADNFVDVGSNPGSELRKIVRRDAKVERVTAIKPAPELVAYHDFGSETTNDQVTVGNGGHIVGSRLKFDAAKADEGIYFVPTTGAATKVATVMYNKPGRLEFIVPETLVPGTYELQVRARMGEPPAGTDNRQLRVGRLDATLTV